MTKSRKSIEIQFRRWMSGKAPSRYIEYIAKPTTREQYIKHIESTFSPGMSWENFGTVWEFDHILPLHYFDFSNENDIKLALNISNIRACLKSNNKNKGASVADAYMVLLRNKSNTKLLEKSKALFDGYYPDIKILLHI